MGAVGNEHKEVDRFGSPRHTSCLFEKASRSLVDSCSFVHFGQGVGQSHTAVVKDSGHSQSLHQDLSALRQTLRDNNRLKQILCDRSDVSQTCFSSCDLNKEALFPR